MAPWGARDPGTRDPGENCSLNNGTTELLEWHMVAEDGEWGRDDGEGIRGN